MQDIDTIDPGKWLSYWKGNPINAWTGGNRSGNAKPWFALHDGRFSPTFHVTAEERETFQAMVQELIDYRFASYEPRLPRSAPAQPTQPPEQTAEILPFRQPGARNDEGVELHYFPSLRIACGHFRCGETDVKTICRIDPGIGRLDPARHFVARAIGDSMNGGKQPVQDGDFLLLERLDSARAGSITGSLMVIERQDVSGDDQYLLRLVTKTPDGRYMLKATNPDYPEYLADDSMRTLARLRAVLSEESVTLIGGGKLE